MEGLCLKVFSSFSQAGFESASVSCNFIKLLTEKKEFSAKASAFNWLGTAESLPTNSEPGFRVEKIPAGGREGTTAALSLWMHVYL